MARLTDLVVVSGYSGAGKSSAMNVFEDAGYFCVDNLPAEMIRSLSELFRHEGSKVERAAVVSDSRGGPCLCPNEVKVTASLPVWVGSSSSSATLRRSPAELRPVVSMHRSARSRTGASSSCS